MIGEEGDDLFCKRMEVFGAGVIEGDLSGEGILLFHEGAEKEQEPGFPVGLGGAEGGLGAAEGAVVAFLGGLDDALQSALVNQTTRVSISRGVSKGEVV